MSIFCKKREYHPDVIRLAMEITEICLLNNDRNGLRCFVWYSGHVDSLDLRIYSNYGVSYERDIYLCSLHYDTDTPEEKEGEENYIIEKLETIKKEILTVIEEIQK